MHAIILAGGRGLRLQELTHACPKGLVPVGERPIIDHIIKHLIGSGVTQVTIAAGYRAEDFEEYVANRYPTDEVTVIDTGEHTDTGGRVRRLAAPLLNNLDPQDPVLLCWCDGLSDLDIQALLAQHAENRTPVTLTAVHPPARFGDVRIDGNKVIEFAEKQAQLDRWISGGYFVITPQVLDYIKDDASSWERDVLPALVNEGQLGVYQHTGRWECMDTLHDQQHLNRLLKSNQAFWPVAD